MSISTSTPWFIDFREFTRKAIKEQVVANVRNQDFRTVFPRRRQDFIEAEIDKLLLECWKFFPVWHASFDRTRWGGPLAVKWDKFEPADKEKVAKDFKESFYRQNRLWQSKLQ